MSFPMRLTPAMQATAIKAINSAYSDMVAAPSSSQSSFARLIVVSSLRRQPSRNARDEFVDFNCKLDASPALRKTPRKSVVRHDIGNI